MTREEMKCRTKAFANRVVKLCEALPNRWVARTLGNQLLRSGTSVGANYRAVCRARSRADFISKFGIVEEEVGESLYWMELLVDAELVSRERLYDLMQEAHELTAIAAASIKTLKANSNSKIPTAKS